MTMELRATGAQQLRVLVSGASFAGLATAWWMSKLGHAVTVVEIARDLRKGGTPVDIREGVIDVVRRMGLLDQIAALSLNPRNLDFVDAQGTPVVTQRARDGEGTQRDDGYEIERDVLLDLLFNEVKDRVQFLFAESIASLQESAEEIVATFASGRQQSFSLLIGCDGTHSGVRRMCFGEEAAYSLFLKHYFSLTIVDRLLIEEDTSVIYNVPGKTVMLNAYNNKTDIGFCFFSNTEEPYVRRDQDRQKQMIVGQFAMEGWRIPGLLDEMLRCDNFYFDKLCQIRMKSWTCGRVALVGDAGYCPSPAAGMGGSMAILGAAALADAFERNGSDFHQAFKEYDERLRPIVEEIQTEAIESGLEMFAPRTEEAIRLRNLQLSAAVQVPAGV